MGHAPLVIIMTCFNCVGYIVGAVFRALSEASRALIGAGFFARFGSRIQSLAGVSIVVGLTAYLLAVTGMALIITEVTGFDETVAILMVWASYTLFTLYSGSRGVILTDTAMFLLFSGIIVVASLFIVDAAGWFHAIQSLATYTEKPDLIAWHGRVGPEVYWKTPLDGLFWATILGSRGESSSQSARGRSLFDGQ